MLDGYLTVGVDAGPAHFHLCLEETRGLGRNKTPAVWAQQRPCRRAVFYRTLRDTCTPASWGIRLWNGAGEQMLTVFLPTPFWSHSNKRLLPPDWSRLALWNALRARYPLVLHGVSLNLGSSDPLREDYLDQLAALVDRVEPAWVSDHLCWTGAAHGQLHDLLPLPYGEAALAHLLPRIQHVQERIGQALVLENISSYLQFEADELPDHLPVVLEFASTQPPEVAREFLGEMAHILNALFSALVARSSPYASVVAAVLEVSGQRVQSVALTPEPAMDEVWAEPEAFGGCSTQGQSKPGNLRDGQPVHFVRNARAERAPQGVSA